MTECVGNFGRKQSGARRIKHDHSTGVRNSVAGNLMDRLQTDD